MQIEIRLKQWIIIFVLLETNRKYDLVIKLFSHTEHGDIQAVKMAVQNTFVWLSEIGFPFNKRNFKTMNCANIWNTINAITTSLKYAAESTNVATDPIIWNMTRGNTNKISLKEGSTSGNIPSLWE